MLSALALVLPENAKNFTVDLQTYPGCKPCLVERFFKKIEHLSRPDIAGAQNRPQTNDLPAGATLPADKATISIFAKQSPDAPREPDRGSRKSSRSTPDVEPLLTANLVRKGFGAFRSGPAGHTVPPLSKLQFG